VKRVFKTVSGNGTRTAVVNEMNGLPRVKWKDREKKEFSENIGGIFASVEW